MQGRLADHTASWFPISICRIVWADAGLRRCSVCRADLDKLQQEEVAHICEWLTEKVDSYSTRLNPEPKDEPEEVRLQLSSSCGVLCRIKQQAAGSCPLLPTVLIALPILRQCAGIRFSSSHRDESSEFAFWQYVTGRIVSATMSGGGGHRRRGPVHGVRGRCGAHRQRQVAAAPAGAPARRGRPPPQGTLCLVAVLAAMFDVYAP